jgi:hypothetical protein
MKILIKVAPIFSLLLMMTGCLSPQQIRQQQADTCVSYGFKAGTNQFAQCMMMQARQADRAAECSRAGLRGFARANPTDSAGVQMAAGGDAEAACLAGYPPVRPQRQPDPPPPNMMPKNTNCTSSGNAINCITY